MTEKEKKDILELNEINTFFLIDECGSFIWKMSEEMKKGTIAQSSTGSVMFDIQNVRKVQQFAVDNLGRFGIDPKSANDKKDGDYWKWYRFWNKWKKDLSNKDWTKISIILSKEDNPELTKFLPTGKWND